MVPLYAARDADLGHGDFVKVDCAARLSPEFLSRLGLAPYAKVLDLQERVRCRGCGVKGRAVVSVTWGSRSLDAMATRHSALVRGRAL